jgi:peptide/nickel transport system substrate-binding protein
MAVVRNAQRLVFLSVIALLMPALGCASVGQTPRPADTGAAAPATQRFVARPLNAAHLREPGAIGGKFSGGRSGLVEYNLLFAAPLFRADHRGDSLPILAEEVPSQEQGSWNLLPDQRMETTYRLRATASWHDGTPFTAQDVIFTWQVTMNPTLPGTDREAESLVESMEALDQRTVRVVWRAPYIYANVLALEPLPRHVLEPLLQRDPQAFLNAPFWTEEWVGLGPYRVTEWVHGSYIRGQAFPGYVLGAPRIPEIILHFVADANQGVARMLAGAVDLTLASVVRIEEGVTLKEQLEARGEGTIFTRIEGTRIADFQYRDPQPAPARDVRVRQALAHAIDRQLLADTLLHGYTVPAHSFIAPDHPEARVAERVVRKYEYDPARALQLLADAGWTRGPDGLLRSASGERFDLESRTTETLHGQQEAQIVNGFWRQVGVNTALEIIPRARQQDQEYRAKFPGANLGNTNSMPDGMTNWVTANIPSDATRWRGRNRSGYSRLEIDQLVDAFFVTIDTPRRNETFARVAQLFSEDVTYVPFYYQVDPYAIRNGLKGLVGTEPGYGRVPEENVHLWYWER